MGHIKVVSWFPPPSVWNVNGFAWPEWTEASENFFKDILQKIQGNKFQPLSKADWRKNCEALVVLENYLKLMHIVQ